MISVDEVLLIHRRLIEVFGGSDGVRDEGIMLSAIARPYSGFGDTEFYETPVEKADAIVESIVTNHPFIDGNKRVMCSWRSYSVQIICSLTPARAL
jgi:death-on-curing protein